MTINKGLLIAATVLLVAGLVGALVVQSRMANLKADLAAQTTRAERAIDAAAALEAAAAYRETQLFALQGHAAQCEEARSREAADAAERRAITGPAREAARTDAQGGIASPQISKPQGSPHENTRRAVAARLNRPL